MSRTKTLPGPSRLSQVLAGLRTGPRLELRSLQNLKLTLAAKNDHFGARCFFLFLFITSILLILFFLKKKTPISNRHFVNGQLPRIRYANPDLNIQVSKIPGNPTAEMILTFGALADSKYIIGISRANLMSSVTTIRQRRGSCRRYAREMVNNNSGGAHGSCWRQFMAAMES
jgi:hypothetical protein